MARKPFAEILTTAAAEMAGPRKPRKPKTPKTRETPAPVGESIPALVTAAPAEVAETPEAPKWNPNGWNNAADYTGGFAASINLIVSGRIAEHPEEDAAALRATLSKILSNPAMVISLDFGTPEVCTMADMWDLLGMAAEGEGEYKPLPNGDGFAARWDGGQSTMVALFVRDFRGETPADVAKRLETYTTAA